jgi:hypothetical protein
MLHTQESASSESSDSSNKIVADSDARKFSNETLDSSTVTDTIRELPDVKGLTINVTNNLSDIVNRPPDFKNQEPHVEIDPAEVEDDDNLNNDAENFINKHKVENKHKESASSESRDSSTNEIVADSDARKFSNETLDSATIADSIIVELPDAKGLTINNVANSLSDIANLPADFKNQEPGVDIDPAEVEDDDLNIDRENFVNKQEVENKHLMDALGSNSEQTEATGIV